MKFSVNTSPPAWFKFRSTMQEDVVAGMQEEIADLDELQAKEFEKAREDALPLIAETVRDQDSRPASFVTGNVRPWTQTVWERVQRNKFKRNHPIKYFIFTHLPFLNHAKYTRS